MSAWPLRARRWARGAALAVALATAAWLLGPGVASAHAQLTQADPAPGSVVARSPAVAT
jgi:methionine-rich copper-binding protein CopC